MAFTINHLTGRACLWGTAEWERQIPTCGSFQTFVTELRTVFGKGSYGSDTARNLLSPRQGIQTVADQGRHQRNLIAGAMGVLDH